LAKRQRGAPRALVEFESHVRDEVEDLVREGWNSEEAFRTVIGSVEGLGVLDHEFTKSRAVRGFTCAKILRMILPALTCNYLKTALRKIRRQTGYSLINTAGLAVGMACCVLILLYVQHEWSFDRYHENSRRIFRLVAERKTPDGTRFDATTPPPLGPALTRDLPSVAQVVRFLSPDNPTPLVARGDARFYEKKFVFADPSVFIVFTMPFLEGDPETALRKPYAVVLTASMARKYFGRSDPLGKTLRFNNAFDLEVTGVVADPPSNSILQFDLLASFETAYDWLGKDFLDDWENNTCQTYALLAGQAPPDVLARQLPGIIEKHLGSASTLKRLHLQPLRRIHLFSDVDYGLPSAGDIHRLFLLFGIAIFILLIACINFVNLTTVSSTARSREIAVRTLMGATKTDLVRQFFWESLLKTAVALGLALAFVRLGLPRLGALVGTDLSRFAASHWQAWAAPIGIALLAGFLAGSAPAFILSSVMPLNNLKGPLMPATGRSWLRKGLVVVQFALMTVLIIGTWLVHNQLTFMERTPLGFDKDQVIVIPIRDQSLRQDLEGLKRRLLQRPGVTGVGAAALLPGGPTGKTRFRAEGTLEAGTMSMLWVDQDFIKTLGITLAAGRDFSRDFTTDASASFILNEAAVTQLGWRFPADAIGKSFELLGGKKGAIIGVVKDFNFVSLHRKIEPLVLHIWPWLNYVLVRVRGAPYSTVLADIETLWPEFEPGYPFTYFFLSDNFERFYQAEKQLREASLLFSLLGIVIGCLGLLGLTAVAAEQRTKEIGVRKVLGASVPGLVMLLARELLALVLLANVVAWPLAYYALSLWLRDYSYRITVGWNVFLLTGILTLVIASATLSYRSIKTAKANPVDSLRYQ
jgi:putative ABC transport system permease protein